MKRLIPIIILTFLATNLIGQNCADNISQATIFYNQGQFNKAIEKVSPCKTSEDKTERWKAFRLLAMAYLGNEDNAKAREAAREMLKLNPRYKASTLNDPKDLIKLLSSITVIPKLSLGLAFSSGINATIPEITDAFMVTDMTKTYTGRNSFQFGLSSSYQFNENFALNLTVMSSSKSYDIDYSFGNWELEAEEKLTYLNIPIMLRYVPKVKSRVRPFVQAGGFAGFLMYSDNSFYAKFKPSGESYSLEHINSSERRNKVDFGLSGGVGAYYKLGDGQLFFQANYFHSMNNAVKSENRYQYDELLYSYHYLDDDFKLHNITFGIGYSLYLNYKVLND
jgi:outer membrane protein W